MGARLCYTNLTRYKRPMKKYAIHSIYMATEGEGVRIGTPQVFVRFMGCNIGCLNCDSKDTWDFTEPNMSLEEILTKIEAESGVNERRIKAVSITGGDPMHPKHVPQVMELARALKQKGYFINVEASGMRVVHEVFDFIDFISFDIKTPSTGVKINEKVIKNFVTQYQDKGQVKSVIQNRHDFDFVYDIYTRLEEELGEIKTPFVLTPCFEPGSKLPKVLTQSIVELNHSLGAPFKVILQQHKVIYTSDFGNF
jgi:7-carboxy-7-deazaguanine synthase